MQFQLITLGVCLYIYLFICDFLLETWCFSKVKFKFCEWEAIAEYNIDQNGGIAWQFIAKWSLRHFNVIAMFPSSGTCNVSISFFLSVVRLVYFNYINSCSGKKWLMRPQANCCFVVESDLADIHSNEGFIGSWLAVVFIPLFSIVVTVAAFILQLPILCMYAILDWEPNTSVLSNQRTVNA